MGDRSIDIGTLGREMDVRDIYTHIPTSTYTCYIRIYLYAQIQRCDINLVDILLSGARLTYSWRARFVVVYSMALRALPSVFECRNAMCIDCPGKSFDFHALCSLSCPDNV